jgi:hypothetical protein
VKPNLAPEVVNLIESGVSILIGTRDAQLRPATVRGVGARLVDDVPSVEVVLPVSTAEQAIANLRENGQIAVGFSRPFDNLSIQIKGRCVEIRPAREDERHLPERYLIGLAEMLGLIGMPRAVVHRVNCWPAWIVKFPIRDMFLQTPGPEAGKRMGFG